MLVQNIGSYLSDLVNKTFTLRLPAHGLARGDLLLGVVDCQLIYVGMFIARIWGAPFVNLFLGYCWCLRG